MNELLLLSALNGLVIGSFYALMALGLSLIINLTKVINFAHGGFLAVSAYLAYSMSPYVGFWGALLIAPILTAVVGLMIESVAIRPLYGRDPLYSLLLTFGLAYVLQDAAQFIWGAQSLPFRIPQWLAAPVSNSYFFVTGYRVLMIVVMVVAVGILFSTLYHTRLGIRIRAGTLDLDMVAASGVNIRILRNLNFGIGVYLAGVAGVLAAGVIGLQPAMGESIIMPSFVAIIVGGIGSLIGTVIGGLLIGVAAGIVGMFFPSAAELVIYLMMVIVLLFRPRGLFGQKEILL